MYPALVILRALGKDADPVLWVGGQGGMEEELVKKAGIPYTAIPAAGVHGVGAKAMPGNLLRLLRGALASTRLVRQFNPDVLLFTGGYVAAPMAVAARSYPSLLYVPDIEPGMALKFLAGYATQIALTEEDSRAYFPSAKHVAVTGYPIRSELGEWQRNTGRAHLGLEPDRFTLLVTGGSKGAQTLNHPVLAILPQLLTEMQVIHISGQPDWQLVQDTRAALPPELAERYHVMPYLHEMGAALAAADLVVSRAGASTLGEYPFFGLPAILVPYPYAWRYQKVNADYLVNKGAALMMETEHLSDQLLSVVQSLAHRPEELKQMSEKMRSLAKPDAAVALADLIRQLAGVHTNREK